MATQITMVKKIKADGSPCNKCDQVTAKLEKEGHMDKITKCVKQGVSLQASAAPTQVEGGGGAREG